MNAIADGKAWPSTCRSPDLRNSHTLSKFLPEPCLKMAANAAKCEPAIQQPVGKCCSVTSTLPSKAQLWIPQPGFCCVSESLQAHPLPPVTGLHPSSSEMTGCIRPFRITFGSHFQTDIQDIIFRRSYTGICKNSLLCFYPKWGLFQASFPTLVISLKLFALNNPIPEAHESDSLWAPLACAFLCVTRQKYNQLSYHLILFPSRGSPSLKGIYV